MTVDKDRYDEGYERAFGHAGPTGSVKARVYGPEDPAKMFRRRSWEFLPIQISLRDMEFIKFMEFIAPLRKRQLWCQIPKKILQNC